MFGPGIWVFDPYRLTGRVQSVNPAWGVDGLDPFIPGGITSHHIAVGTFGILAGLFHIAVGTLGILAFYDYIRNNPEKWGLFRADSMDNGDGIMVDVPFLRAKLKYSVEQVGVIVEFYGSELHGVSYSDPAIVKKYARHAQLGEIFELDRATLKSDGVFRSSPRGWFNFGHASFALLFFFGHIRHGHIDIKSS
ncbi:hypothetical protein KIW84_030475 [Lathyrus oleraceus]|uniref:Photosystem II CP47 reaction center protein n=1 Tax=Pisum sativum TaxID=3888 RepID=A0A9D4XQJ0_PEA|nr:hypothetical protein KIW84_030475 [Pisum sativum]